MSNDSDVEQRASAPHAAPPAEPAPAAEVAAAPRGRMGWFTRLRTADKVVFSFAAVVLVPLLVWAIADRVSAPSAQEAQAQYAEENFRDGVTQILDGQGLAVVEDDWPAMRAAGHVACTQLTGHQKSVASLYMDAFIAGGGTDSTAVTRAVVTEAIQEYCPAFIGEREAFREQQNQTPSSG
ncbi:hypothetical protein ABEG17_08335 [Pedococcus sp. KACC 23699]|uniref:DUF732 domain-containing protein n=1 Tax=Pedococcus sp. KACC 23699 TaxID=3149228 RepID=A0AAU7JZN8_9MICO